MDRNVVLSRFQERLVMGARPQISKTINWSILAKGRIQEHEYFSFYLRLKQLDSTACRNIGYVFLFANIFVFFWHSSIAERWDCSFSVFSEIYNCLSSFKLTFLFGYWLLHSSWKSKDSRKFDWLVSEY